MSLLVDADLSLEIERPGGATIHCRLTGGGNWLTMEVDDPGAFAGSGDAHAIRALAEGLASQGVRLSVVHEGSHLVTIGAVSAPWWQRRVTGTRRIRLGGLRGAWTSGRSRARRTTPVLPDSGLAPAATLWPIAPTMQRRPRRAVTTTHDPARGGQAHLVHARGPLLPGTWQPYYWLRDGLTIGSAETCDVTLPGLAPVHARLSHDEADEWVVHAVGGVTRVHGAPVVAQILRTGSRVEMGEHTFTYARAEYADHGRPFGGRIGGELGRQAPQPPREELQGRSDG